MFARVYVFLGVCACVCANARTFVCDFVRVRVRGASAWVRATYVSVYMHV